MFGADHGALTVSTTSWAGRTSCPDRSGVSQVTITDGSDAGLLVPINPVTSGVPLLAALGTTAGALTHCSRHDRVVHVYRDGADRPPPAPSLASSVMKYSAVPSPVGRPGTALERRPHRR